MPGSRGEGRDGIRYEPALQLIEPGSRKPGKDVPGKEITLVEVGVAAQDKRAHSHVHVAMELREHLIGISDDGAAAATAGETDPAPEMRFEIEILALGSELILALDAVTLAVL